MPHGIYYEGFRLYITSPTPGSILYYTDDGSDPRVKGQLYDGSLNVSSSSDQEKIKRELHQDLWPFRGTVCLFNNSFKRTWKQYIFGGGTYYCGSRFTLLNSVEFTDEFAEEVRESSASQGLAEAFIINGGIPNYSQQFTIIGQTYEGLDVVDALASLESKSNGEYNIPIEEVKVISVKIDTYHAENTEAASEKK